MLSSKCENLTDQKIIYSSMKLIKTIKRKTLLIRSFFSKNAEIHENSADISVKTTERQYSGMEDYAQWAGIEASDQYKMLYENVQNAIREKKMSLK